MTFQHIADPSQLSGGMDLTPAMDIRAILSDAILALDALGRVEALSDEDWAQLVEVRGPDTIAALTRLRESMPTAPLRVKALPELALDLLTIHEDTGISLDAWVAGREFVEAYTGPIEVNGA